MFALEADDMLARVGGGFYIETIYNIAVSIDYIKNLTNVVKNCI